ncbi:hypothetical protein V9T40_010961 [Parthenolecanium corni]|uniref:Uncharacterized protein n=1 Tax=Parthenolecanium corni TaxID=536013 RepID=A0AAN9T717_9HEMI
MDLFDSTALLPVSTHQDLRACKGQELVVSAINVSPHDSAAKCQLRHKILTRHSSKIFRAGCTTASPVPVSIFAAPRNTVRGATAITTRRHFAPVRNEDEFFSGNGDGSSGSSSSSRRRLRMKRKKEREPCDISLEKLPSFDRIK